METISGLDAIRLAQEVSRVPDGTFTVAFYPYNRTKGIASSKLEIRKDCKTRAQLPQEVFAVESDNYFCFQNMDGDPKTCYRILWRFIGLPPDYRLRKIDWLGINT